MIHIPKWEKDAIKEEQNRDRPDRKCEYCGWYIRGVCKYDGIYGCELDEIKGGN
jgi:hypothetical protein